METNNYKLALLVAFGVGLIIGIGLGSYFTIKAVADVASRFIDKELVEQAVFQYKNNIAQCYPTNLSLR